MNSGEQFVLNLLLNEYFPLVCCSKEAKQTNINLLLLNSLNISLSSSMTNPFCSPWQHPLSGLDPMEVVIFSPDHPGSE